MDLNTIVVAILGCGVLYASYVIWGTSKENPDWRTTTPIWSEQVGRTRPIQSKHGDASMMTELVRRRTIQRVANVNPSKVREARTAAGASTGAMEAFSMTSICSHANEN